MTTPGDGEPIYREIPLNESGEAFRERRQSADDFYRIIQQFEIERAADPSEEKARRTNLFLDSIFTLGINEVAQRARDSMYPMPELQMPAKPAEVREYLQWVSLSSGARFKDSGSVDEDLVGELALTDERYIEELRLLFSFLDPEALELSVLDLPKVRREMLDLELSGYKDAVAKTVVETIHGISSVFDNDDPAEWAKLRALAEQLSTDYFRDYSLRLRKRKEEGLEPTPMRDVYDTVEDMIARRNRTIALVSGSADASPVERRRLLEGLSEKDRQTAQRFFEELDDRRDEEAASLADPDALEPQA